MLLACLSLILCSLTSHHSLLLFLLLFSLSGHRALGEVSVEGGRDHVSPDPGEEPRPGGTASAGVRGENKHPQKIPSV